MFSVRKNTNAKKSLFVSVSDTDTNKDTDSDTDKDTYPFFKKILFFIEKHFPIKNKKKIFLKGPVSDSKVFFRGFLNEQQSIVLIHSKI